MAILNRIKFDGLSSREWLIYKYPGENIVMGSTLIVGEGQAAVFVYQGRIADVFTAGAYVLSSGNLPILSRLVNLPYGGNTPFPSEIYYINTTTKMDMLWGTTDAIQLIDPKYFVRLHIRTFGQFAVKIINIPVFLRELIGALGNSAVKYKAVTEFYKGILNTKVKTIVSDIIINQKISAFEITPKLEEISGVALERLRPDFAKYGLDVVNFYIQSVNFPDEDTDKINKILEDRAAFEIMGDSRYATKRSFDVYEGAANNSSGGIAGAFLAGGMGIGMGTSMAANAQKTIEPVMEPTVGCPKCGFSNKKGTNFCSHCGAPLAPKKITCSNCGAEVDENARFCNNCGTSLVKKICVCGAELAPGSRFCPECGSKQEV